MAVQMASYTQAMREKAERLAELVPTFTRGRDKRTGIEYITVPSSDDPEHAGHNTNGLGCSCKGYDRRGFCTHALAVSLWDQRQQAIRIAAAQKLRREHGTCKQVGCIQTASTRMGRCEMHTRAILSLVAEGF